jgi:UDP-N-acetylglucosamine 2-epimerase
LKNAFEKLYSDEFQLKLKKIENPYYQTNSSIKIKKILKNISLHHIIYKEFVDLK